MRVVRRVKRFLPPWLRKAHFWGVIAALTAAICLHYLEGAPLVVGGGVVGQSGLARPTIARLVFLGPMIYAAFALGFRGGIAVLVASAAAMIPRAVMLSDYPRDALFEALMVITVGALVNWWLRSRRCESGRREQMMEQLDAKQRELQSYIHSIKANERRISALHSVSSAFNQSLEMQELFDTVGDKIVGVMDVDAVVLYLLDEKGEKLHLKVSRGLSAEFAHKIAEMGVGEGLNGWVAQTGEPCVVRDSTLDLRVEPRLVRGEGIKSQFVLPLKSGDRVMGTLGVATRDVRQFTTEEEELLVLISIQLSLALEKARFFQELQRVGRRFKEVFEKAYDAIWIQDLSGTITNVNRAVATILGADPDELVGRNVTEFLTPGGVEVAREVRLKLLRGEPIKQPYEQHILRKDGTKAMLMLTTSLLEDEGRPSAFQHIARDITEEIKLRESLELYAAQISKAHEEERKRIARELHDDTIQTMIAISRRLDGLAAEDAMVLGEGGVSLKQLKEDIDEALVRTRRFVQDLRPPTLEYLGLMAALRELTNELREQSQIRVGLKIKGSERRFTSDEELLIYRIVQEALSNVWKHSQASRVSINIEFAKGLTTVVVADDGRGCEADFSSEFLKAGKLGMMGMKERAHLLGGNLSVSSKLGEGTTVTLEIPSKRTAVGMSLDE